MPSLKKELAEIEQKERARSEGKKSFIELQGIPIELPLKPADKLIHNYGLPKHKQKFKYTPLPSEDAPLEEIIDFLEKDTRYWREGYWLFINGVPTYLPGKYYFILNYIEDDEGRFEYRDAQRRYMIFKEFCEKDPLCFGTNLLKYRRFGGTGLELGSILFDAITNERAKCGLLSKSGKKDAGENFERLTRMFDRMPAYVKPQLDGKARSKSELHFISPTKKITVNNQVFQRANGLDSKIDWRACALNAYDGTRKYRLHVDEPGKWKEVSVKKWWEIGRPTLLDGKRIVGKASFTTTINEDKEGGYEFKEIYRQSDFFKKDKNGNTPSGLYKYFVPAYDGLNGFIDEFGNSVIETPKADEIVHDKEGNRILIGAREYLLNQREGKKDDPEGLAELKRQYPFTEEEALRTYDKLSCFHTSNIESQLLNLEFEKINTESKVIVQPGNFVWENGIRGSRVLWHPTSEAEGRWRIVWGVNSKQFQNNVFTRIGSDILPPRFQEVVFGCDPFDHDDTIDPRSSKGASHGYRIENPLDPHNSDMFISEYYFRQPTSNQFYEDMIMQSVFFGGLLFVESNRGAGLKSYFKERGYGSYLMKIPTGFFDGSNNNKLLEGVSATKASSALISAIEAYSYEKCNRVLFDRTLKDWIGFDPNNTTKFDLTMSSGYTLLAAQRQFKVAGQSKNLETPLELLPVYDNSDFFSKRI